MTDAYKTVVGVVLDRSGSMSSIQGPTIKGFNELIAGQVLAPGVAWLYLAQFDHEYDVIHDMTPMAKVPPLTAATYQPRGNTALLDAIGKTIDDIGMRLKAMPEDFRPGKVVIAIMTDGEENASRKFTRSQVFDMISHQRERYSWQFLFMGANQDAIKNAATIGIHASNAALYSATALGTENAFALTSGVLRSYRAAGQGASLTAFTDEDRASAVAP